MTTPILLLFGLCVVFTAFLAGVFGIAGGMILMGALLFMVSVPEAMVLHAITQGTSNGWRAAMWRRYVLWGLVGRYCIGLLIAGLLFSLLRLVPDPRIVFIVLGIVPFLSLGLPAWMVPQAGRPLGAEICGFVCTALQLLSGVSGPLLDAFFVRSDYDRRQVVATKAACQIVTHIAKLVYFGFLVGEVTGAAFDPVVLMVAVSMAILGTVLSRRVLEALTDHSFRRYTAWLVMAVGAVFIVRGLMGYL